MLKAKQINSRATSNAFPLGFEKKVESKVPLNFTFMDMVKCNASLISQ